VPKDIVLFRMIPTASHTDEDVERTIAAYKKVRDDLHLDLDAVKAAFDRAEKPDESEA
jgi:glycine C-acetyltransferase